MTYFIGATYSRMLIEWYGFIAPGALFASKQDSIQQGAQYYYNLGIGRHISKEIKPKSKIKAIDYLHLQFSKLPRTRKQAFFWHTIRNTG